MTTKPQASPLKAQLKSNYFASAVPPLTNSNIQLPGGQGKPNYYCLGVDSTVPFVSLQGGGATQKVFSWGEMIEVGPGQNVTVKNESYMIGDICINAGNDYAAKPERISLAVTVTPPTPFPGDLTSIRVNSIFPADTRRCRRAYLAYQARTAGGFSQINFIIRGKPVKHSFPGTDSATGQQTYTMTHSLNPLTSGGIIPLGYGSPFSGNDLLDLPMALTDQVSWELRYDVASPPSFLNTLFMYILEY